MKISKEHYAILEKQITDFCKANPEWFEEQSKLLSTVALGWRIVTLSGCIPFICDSLYGYLNDNHITSALKAIITNYRKEHTNASAD